MQESPPHRGHVQASRGHDRRQMFWPFSSARACRFRDSCQALLLIYVVASLEQKSSPMEQWDCNTHASLRRKNEAWIQKGAAHHSCSRSRSASKCHTRWWHGPVNNTCMSSIHGCIQDRDQRGTGLCLNADWLPECPMLCHSTSRNISLDYDPFYTSEVKKNLRITPANDIEEDQGPLE